MNCMKSVKHKINSGVFDNHSTITNSLLDSNSYKGRVSTKRSILSHPPTLLAHSTQHTTSYPSPHDTTIIAEPNNIEYLIALVADVVGITVDGIFSRFLVVLGSWRRDGLALGEVLILQAE